MSKPCPMCKLREVVVRGRCAECDEVMAERWKDIDRRDLNAVWLEGGVEAVEEVKRERRTCADCGHEHPTERWKNCEACGSSALAQAADALSEIADRLDRELNDDPESTP